jgi:hypothetical protein
MIFYKLKPISQVFSGSLGASAPSLVNQAGTVVNYTSGFPPTVIPELFNPISKQYCMYSVSDATLTGKATFTRLSITWTVTITEITAAVVIPVLIPIGIPFRMYMTRTLWNSEAFKAFNPNAPAIIDVPLSAIEAISLTDITKVTEHYPAILGSALGSIADCFTVFEYQR